MTFLPVVAKSVFKMDARGYSWLLTAYGLGSVLGALLVAASGNVARKGRLALLLQLAFAVALIAFAFSRRLPLSMIIAFVAGACIVGVMSIFMLAFRGGMPLGNLIAGFVAQRWSITTALAINGTLLAIVAVTFILRGTNLDTELGAHARPAV